MRRQGWILRCKSCGNEYDLVLATDRSDKDGKIKCPNCGNTIGTRQN